MNRRDFVKCGLALPLTGTAMAKPRHGLIAEAIIAEEDEKLLQNLANHTNYTIQDIQTHFKTKQQEIERAQVYLARGESKNHLYLPQPDAFAIINSPLSLRLSGKDYSWYLLERDITTIIFAYPDGSFDSFFRKDESFKLSSYQDFW